MRTQSIEARLSKTEQILAQRSIYSADCICFPKGVQPAFAWAAEMRIATELKCPLHGERFAPFPLTYMPIWLLEKRERCLLAWTNDQYMKAWYASFPPELWPAMAGSINGKIFLILKDGTELPAD